MAGWWNSWSDTATRLFSPLGGGSDRENSPVWDLGGRFTADPGAIADAARKQQLYGQAANASQFADQAQQGYGAYGAQGNDALRDLRAQANGQRSISAMQLQQGLQQNLAAQQAQAAGAAPQNQAMAARTAAIQSGRLGSGLAGQQALAGLQERNQAQQQYGTLLQGLRGQDMNAALQSRQAAVNGYGAGAVGAPEKTNVDKYGGAIMAGLAAFSDRRLKTDVKDGERAARSALQGLSAHSFSYKNEAAHGKGKQLGVMAQDLERAGLGHAVVDTPRGKMVNGAKLATSLAAMMPGLDARLSKLEGGKR